jgi:cell division protein FtsB
MPHDDYVYDRVRERLEVEYDLDGRAAKSELGKLVKRVETLENPKSKQELGKLVKRVEVLEQNVNQAKSEPKPDDTAPPARRATT